MGELYDMQIALKAFKSGKQKECRKVRLGQVTTDKVYQFKTELEVITWYPYSSTLAILVLDVRS